MSITYNDLIARAQQVRDESEIGANTATRVGQLLADIIQWCQDNNADLGEYLLNFTAHLNERGGILNWFQSRIVLLKTMGSGYDDVSVGSLSDGDVYYDSQGNWIREKQGPAAINGIHPSKGVFYVNLANKTAYQWDGTTFDHVTQIVNNLHQGGEGDALSAEMGKVLRKNVAIIAAKVDSIINALAGIAFVGSPVAPIGQLDWEGAAQTTYSVTTNFTGCDATETLPQTVNELATLSFTIEAEQGYSLPYGIKVTVGGSPVAASYNRATGAVSIEAILGDVVIEAVALDEDNTAFSGVMIEHVGSTGGYLHVGNYETKYISHLIDLGASRQDSVLVKYAGGSLEMFDSNGDYIGYQSSAASETSVGVTTATRFIRLHGTASSIADGIVKVGDVVAFDGSKVGSDIGDADDFAASVYCPQPNSDGDLVGWMYCKENTAFSGWTNSPSDSKVGTGVKASSTKSLVTAIGTTSQIPWVVGKMVDLPAFVDSTTKRPTAFSSGEIQGNNAAIPNMLLFDSNGAGASYVGMSSGDSGMNDTTRVRTFGIPEIRAKARMVCSLTAYNASRSTETTPTYFTFIKNSQTGTVLWGNDSPITNS